MVDESTIPKASKVLVSGTTISTAGNTLGEMLQKVASDSDSTVVRQVRDLYSPSVRHFYVVSGSERYGSTEWIDEGYPGFSRDTSTVVHRSSELDGMDPRGEYLILGSSEAMQRVSQAFVKLGFETEVTRRISSFGANTSLLLFGPLGSSTLAVLLLVALLAGFSVLSRSKNYAVLRLHGGSKRTAFLRDLRSEGLSFVLIPTVLIGISSAILFYYNEWNQIGNYLWAALVILTVLILSMLSLYIICLIAIFDNKIIAAINGKLGFRVSIPAVYLLRVPSLVLTVSLLASVFAVGAVANRQHHEIEAMGDAGAAAKIVFEGFLSSGDMDRLAFESGHWLKGQDALGLTIMAQEIASAPDGTAISDQVVLVNRGYLRRNSLLGANNEHINDVGSKEAIIMMPPDVRTTAEEIKNMIARGSGGLDGLKVRTVHLQADQPRFLYANSGDGSQPSYTNGNAIFVGIGSDTDIISDDNYMSYASNGSVLMADAQQARAATPSKFMGSWISAYIPIGQLKANEIAQSYEVFRAQLASTVVSLFVLLATGFGLAQLHVRGNAQTILVRHLHGWKFVSTHLWLIKGELAVLGVALAWAVVTCVRAWIKSRVETGPLLHSGELAVGLWQPAIVVIVALCNLALLLYLVNRRSRIMIRTQSEETA